MNPPASARARKLPRSVNTYASSGSPGRRARVVHERDSHRPGRSSSSRPTNAPLPTPPAPNTTNTSGRRAGAGSGPEVLSSGPEVLSSGPEVLSSGPEVLSSGPEVLSQTVVAQPNRSSSL